MIRRTDLPRVVATLVVRDEVDIVAANLDYHLAQGVSQFLVVDNGSVDGTREILAWYEANRPVEVFDEPVGPFHQGRWVSRMAQQAATRYRADWLIHLDADEFVAYPGVSLPCFFAEVPADIDIITVTRHDYVARDAHAFEVAPLTMTVRKLLSNNRYGSPLYPKVFHRAVEGATVEDGNHNVSGQGLAEQRSLSSIAIHHYPIRSRTQAERKIRNIASGLIEAEVYQKGIGTVSVDRRDMIDSGTFDEEYCFHLARTDRQANVELADGTLVIDTSIADRLRKARVSGELARQDNLDQSLNGWIENASEAGALAHRVDTLRSVSSETRRENTLFQIQTKTALNQLRVLIDGPLVLLKGLEVAQLYPEPWQRDYIDIDLLVDDADTADIALREAGYSPLFNLETLPDYHQTAPLARPGSPVTIELHRHPSWPRWNAFPVDELIAQSRPSRTSVDGVMRPRDDHHLLIIAWHFWRDGAHRGRDLVDLHLLRQQVPDEVTTSTAETWGVTKLWKRTRSLLDALVEPDRATLIEKRLLKLELVSHRERRLRQWWGISLGGRTAIKEVVERGVRREQRRKTGAPL
ncbi:MAG: nucleotidyltransferase family protein [Acidimicrobiales bacterium]